ncbi:MAG: hypothetical protein ACJAQT_000286 [Akkermansiaceae bacterium]|jgi:hypothetical protein
MTRRATSLVSVLVLIDPALDTNDSVNGLGLGESIVDGNTKGLKRHFALTIPFGTRNISTPKATSATDTNSVGAKLHGSLDSALHGAAESDTTLELDHDLLANALGVELGLTDLDDVDLHL